MTLGAGSPMRRLSSVRTKTGRAFAFVAAMAVLLLFLAIVYRPLGLLGPPPPSLYLGVVSISGNQSLGWTFFIRVNLSQWVRPGQMPWFNVSFRLARADAPYPVPPGTTLRVLEPSGPLPPPPGLPVAEYNLSGAFWLNGGPAAIQGGQWLVLHGMIPPGSASSGPWLEYTATLGKGTMTMSVPLGVV